MNFSPFMFLSFIPTILFIIIIVGIIAFFSNRNHNVNNMEPNQIKPKATAGDFLLNIGAIIALYTIVSYLLNLTFIVIETSYPQITGGYNYYISQSISWPVSILIILFPIFVIIMGFLEKSYTQDPEKRNVGIHKWLTYITLFIGGIILIADLITVIYYFIDGQELTVGFLLKVFSVLIITLIVFLYYIADIKNTLTPSKRKTWLTVSTLVVVASIVWGFSVLGSPQTQRLLKYDQQKVNDLQTINSQIQNYFYSSKVLPKTLDEIISTGNFYGNIIDTQTKKPYEYEKTGDKTYSLCAEFNKTSNNAVATDNGVTYPPEKILYLYGGTLWTHPAGKYCFTMTAVSDIYGKPMIGN